LVFVVPHAGKPDAFLGKDVNNHISTWSPNVLGHLLLSAGYKVKQVDILEHHWPDDPENLYNTQGEGAFIQAGMVANQKYPLKEADFQVRAVATL